MSNCEWAERVALLMDEEDEAARAHVISCVSCRELMAELESDRDLLRSMPVPDIPLPRIPRPRPLRQWVWAAAAAVILAAWLWPRPAAMETLQIAVRAPSAPALSRLSPPVIQAVVRRGQRMPVPRLAQALEEALPSPVHPPVASDSDVVVAVQTEDPNVIIVLVGGD